MDESASRTASTLTLPSGGITLIYATGVDISDIGSVTGSVPPSEPSLGGTSALPTGTEDDASQTNTASGPNDASVGGSGSESPTGTASVSGAGGFSTTLEILPTTTTSTAFGSGVGFGSPSVTGDGSTPQNNTASASGGGSVSSSGSAPDGAGVSPSGTGSPSGIDGDLTSSAGTGVDSASFAPSTLTGDLLSPTTVTNEFNATVVRTGTSFVPQSTAVSASGTVTYYSTSLSVSYFNTTAVERTTATTVVVPSRIDSTFLGVPTGSTRIVTATLPPQTMFGASTGPCGAAPTVYSTIVVYADYFLCPTTLVSTVAATTVPN